MAESDASPPHALRPGAGHAGLRIMLFASTLVSVIVMVACKQTVFVPVAGIPFPVPISAKFTQFPAFEYFVVVMSAACLYSLITALAALSISKKSGSSGRSLLFLLIWDAVMLALVETATGAAGALGYIGWKGNKHVGWTKICNVYGTFCRHLGSSIAVSVTADLLLLILVVLSAQSFQRCIPK